MTDVVSHPPYDRRAAIPGKVSLSENANRIFVYVMADEALEKLAISMSQDLQTRVQNQKNDLHPRDFTSINAIHTLLHVEEFSNVSAAMARYASLRAMDSHYLLQLIREKNPQGRDLYLHYA